MSHACFLSNFHDTKLPRPDYGSKKDESGTIDEPDEEKCLRLIGESLAVAKTGYEAVAAQMRSFYEGIDANR